MFKLNIFVSFVIFSFLLVGTSIVKNKTRELEKKNLLFNKRNFT